LDNETLLSLNKVRVQFGTLVAVRDLSFELGAGSLLGLIGPNGAGKTTLLRTIAGLQPMTRGTVHVLGEQVLPGRIQALRHIGFTPDNPPAYEELTIRNFLRFIAKGYTLDLDEIDERIDFWLEQVWLKEKANHKIKSLSRGMRQRVGIARTLLPNPHVILLDEPAAGLDPAGRVQFRHLLCSLRDQGKTLIVSSHILADLNEYCTHIAILAKGQLVQFGSVTEVANKQNGQRCRYTIILAHQVPALQDLLEDIEGIDHIQINHDTITLEYQNEREDAAALLSELIHRQVPIAAFTPNTPDLEEVYLRSGIGQVD